jgi:hypothetical protein
MGRADDQVKVKGFRVELDGVSAAMRVNSYHFGCGRCRCTHCLPLTDLRARPQRHRPPRRVGTLGVRDAFYRRPLPRARRRG